MLFEEHRAEAAGVLDRAEPAGNAGQRGFRAEVEAVIAAHFDGLEAATSTKVACELLGSARRGAARATVYRRGNPARQPVPAPRPEPANKLAWQIAAHEVMPAHVHRFVCLGSTDAPTAVVRAFKGRTARVLRQEFPAPPGCREDAVITSVFRHLGRLRVGDDGAPPSRPSQDGSTNSTGPPWPRNPAIGADTVLAAAISYTNQDQSHPLVGG